MRVYELARELGVSSDQVKIWAAPVTIRSASATVAPRDETIIRRKAADAANNQPDPSQAKAKEGIARGEVQSAIDKIVDQYGWDWCGGGVKDVNEILKPLGLSVTPKADRGYVNVTVRFKDMPMLNEDDRFDQAVVHHLYAALQGGVEFEGRKVLLYESGTSSVPPVEFQESDEF